MRIHILSDLHGEFAPFEPPVTNADIIILAGDIQVKQRGVEWARAQFSEKPVLYVLGNHEYYGTAIPRHTVKLQALAAESNIHILENNNISFGDVTFLGCTFWTDFQLLGNPRIAGYAATTQMTDYQKIRLSPEFRRLRSYDTALMHSHSKRWLAAELAQRHGQKTVVITHHAPSKRSIPEQHQSDILSAAYASHLDEFVAASGACLWIHGHIHNARDYTVGRTRVICNPRGYPDEDTDFVPDLVVEI